MIKISVAGLINVESTLQINNFPVPLSSSGVHFSFNYINTNISGVGYNQAKALKTLGAEVNLYTLIGKDLNGKAITQTLLEDKFPLGNVKAILEATPESITLYDKEGNRDCYTDLKSIQDCSYEVSSIDTEYLIVNNINFARPFLNFKDKSIKIVTDLHALNDFKNDDYNKEWMEKSDIVFMSNTNFVGKEKEFVQSYIKTYNNEIIIVGMGKKGALSFERKKDKFTYFPLIETRKTVNTVGAGDALCSCFIYCFAKGFSLEESMIRAIIFASYKVGESGGAKGFLTEKELESLLINKNYKYFEI